MIKGTAIVQEKAESSVREAAFEGLWIEHRQRVWRLVARLAGSVDAADDLAQEVGLRAYEAFPKFRGEACFSTWLYRIAVNVALRHLERQPHAGFAELDSVRDLSCPGPEVAALESAMRPIVWAAINRLPADLRTTLILQVYEGLKYREIASVLNVSLETVKFRRHQALLRLRKELEGYEM